MRQWTHNVIIILIGTLCINACSSPPVNGEVRDGIEYYYHDNGVVKAEVPINDEGNKHGTARYYSSQGTLEQTSTFKNDTLNGEMRSYYPSGQLRNICTFRNGIAEGPVVDYFENGKIQSAGEFSNGRRNGVFITNYESGGVRFRWTYEDGHRIAYVDYEEDGSIHQESISMMVAVERLPHQETNKAHLVFSLKNRHQQADSTRMTLTFVNAKDTIMDTVQVSDQFVRYDFVPASSGSYTCYAKVTEWVNPLNDVVFIARDTVHFSWLPEGQK